LGIENLNFYDPMKDLIISEPIKKQEEESE
jgi:hypothetical protein